MQLYFSTLGFRYFEFRFIYERIPNRIRIRIFGIFVLALVKSDTYVRGNLEIVIHKNI